jgi:hypothetical protein
MAAEVSRLASAVLRTQRDPITRPGEGIGIYSSGFKRLGKIALLVSGGCDGGGGGTSGWRHATHTHETC